MLTFELTRRRNVDEYVLVIIVPDADPDSVAKHVALFNTVDLQNPCEIIRKSSRIRVSVTPRLNTYYTYMFWVNTLVHHMAADAAATMRADWDTVLARLKRMKLIHSDLLSETLPTPDDGTADIPAAVRAFAATEPEPVPVETIKAKPEPEPEEDDDEPIRFRPVDMPLYSVTHIETLIQAIDRKLDNVCSKDTERFRLQVDKLEGTIQDLEMENAELRRENESMFARLDRSEKQFAIIRQKYLNLQQVKHKYKTLVTTNAVNTNHIDTLDQLERATPPPPVAISPIPSRPVRVPFRSS